MKNVFALFFFLVIMFWMAISTHAELIDNGDGTITQIKADGSKLMWLKNVNLAGAMTWDTAMGWADSLTFAGYDDWRLPTALNTDGSGPCQGYTCTDSEMGYLFYTELNNLGHTAPDGSYPQPGWGLKNTGPFINWQPYSSHWSDTEYDTTNAWYFVNYYGFQIWHGGKNITSYYGPLYAWAVRDDCGAECDGPVVNEPPVADAGPDQTIIFGDPVTLDGSASYDEDGSIVSYDWDFDDSYGDSGETVDYTYESAGEYIVTLTVTDDDGATGEDTVTITVLLPEEAVADLISDIEELGLPKGSANSLTSKLESAIAAFEKGK